MPKTTESGKAKESELPSTLQKSDDKAQRTFAKAHDAAAEEYGEGERAHRVAYSALKHSYEKVGDHWEEKDRRGPSDERAESGGPQAAGETAEGVNANATKKHLVDVAKRLNIAGRSRMSKANSWKRSRRRTGGRAARPAVRPCRSARDACIQASSTGGACPPRVPPGCGGCGARGSWPAWHR